MYGFGGSVVCSVLIGSRESPGCLGLFILVGYKRGNYLPPTISFFPLYMYVSVIV